MQEFSAEFFITAIGAIDQMAGNLDRFVFNEALKEAICTVISLERKYGYSCPWGVLLVVVWASISRANGKGHQTEKYPRVVRKLGSELKADLNNEGRHVGVKMNTSTVMHPNAASGSSHQLKLLLRTYCRSSLEDNDPADPMNKCSPPFFFPGIVRPATHISSSGTSWYRILARAITEPYFLDQNSYVTF